MEKPTQALVFLENRNAILSRPTRLERSHLAITALSIQDSETMRRLPLVSKNAMVSTLVLRKANGFALWGYETDMPVFQLQLVPNAQTLVVVGRLGITPSQESFNSAINRLDQRLEDNEITEQEYKQELIREGSERRIGIACLEAQNPQVKFLELILFYWIDLNDFWEKTQDIAFKEVRRKVKRIEVLLEMRSLFTSKTQGITFTHDQDSSTILEPKRGPCTFVDGRFFLDLSDFPEVEELTLVTMGYGDLFVVGGEKIRKLRLHVYYIMDSWLRVLCNFVKRFVMNKIWRGILVMFESKANFMLLVEAIYRKCEVWAKKEARKNIFRAKYPERYKEDYYQRTDAAQLYEDAKRVLVIKTHHEFEREQFQMDE